MGECDPLPWPWVRSDDIEDTTPLPDQRLTEDRPAICVLLHLIDTTHNVEDIFINR